MLTTKCLFCGFEFEVKSYRLKNGKRICCSRQCYYASMKNAITCTCEICGKIFDVPPCKIKKGGGKFCSCTCSGIAIRGENNSRYKAGSLTDGGYVRINVNRKQKYEHQHIMEQHLGRKLEKNEIIHHIDGNGFNNDIENLQIMTRNEHTSLHHRRNGGL